MKVLICGSRNWNPLDDAILKQRIDALPGDTMVLQGGAPGVDFWAKFWASSRGLHVREFKADWAKHGKAAGPIRNRQMLDEQPDLVLAFPGKGSKGTQDTIDEATRRGIPVEVHTIGLTATASAPTGERSS